MGKWLGCGIVLLGLGMTGACASAGTSRAPPPSGSRSPAESADDVAARVRAALHASPVNDAHIQVSVRDGSIVLTGIVEDARALIDALQAARVAADGRNLIDEMSINKDTTH